MNVTEYHRRVAVAMDEADLQRQIIVLGNSLGYASHHTAFSVGSKAGWPDLVMVSPTQQRIMFRELKRECICKDDSDKKCRYHPTDLQMDWLLRLRAAGGDVGVWRPLDLLAGRAEAELRGTEIRHDDELACEAWNRGPARRPTPAEIAELRALPPVRRGTPQ